MDHSDLAAGQVIEDASGERLFVEKVDKTALFVTILGSPLFSETPLAIPFSVIDPGTFSPVETAGFGR